MTVDELVVKLKSIHERQDRGGSDIEADHGEADTALLEFINNKKVDEAYSRIKMWFA